MRVVLTHPYCWPYVRRGAERFMSELALWLSGRGHEVTTISMKPGPALREEWAGGLRILHRTPRIPPIVRRRIEPPHLSGFGVLRSIRNLEADAVYSQFYTETCAALRTRRRGTRVVHQINGPTYPGYLRRGIPPERWLMRKALHGADRLVAQSEFVRRITIEQWGVDPVVLPIPVDCRTFRPFRRPQTAPPTLLAVADFDQRRKGVRVLVRAFEQIKKRIPDARLRLSGQMSPAVRAEVLDPLPDGVVRDIAVLGTGRLEDLPRLYRQAHLTVLPAMYEALGMVILESWASGTPVVVADHGGPGELVGGSGAGILFDPATDAWETHNVEGLVRAILDGLELGSQRDIEERCRAAASRFSWEKLGPRYEGILTG